MVSRRCGPLYQSPDRQGGVAPSLTVGALTRNGPRLGFSALFPIACRLALELRQARLGCFGVAGAG
jgi:hypothetical protein